MSVYFFQRRHGCLYLQNIFQFLAIDIKSQQRITDNTIHAGTQR